MNNSETDVGMLLDVLELNLNSLSRGAYTPSPEQWKRMVEYVREIRAAVVTDGS